MSIYLTGTTAGNSGGTYTSFYTTGTNGVTTYPLSMSCHFYAENLTPVATIGVGPLLTVLNVPAGDPATHNGGHSLTLVFNTTNSGTRIQARTTSAYTVSAVSAQSPGGNLNRNWRFAAAIFTGITARALWNEGVLTTNNSSRNATGFNRFYIGDAFPQFSTLSNRVQGFVQEVGLWNVELDESDITALRRGIKPIYVRPEGLRIYIPGIRDVADFAGGLPITTSGTLIVGDHHRRYG